MKFEIGENCIKVFSKDQFNPKHILECGQVFCYQKVGDKYFVFPANKFAEIEEFEEFYLIKTHEVDYFINWFDLKSDYKKIKRALSENPIMPKPLEFGYGIRILKQDLFETLISFIISANNNIKRISLILNNIRENLGEKIAENVYSFPTYEKLKQCDEDFFKRMGAGYRAGYLVKVLKQITPNKLEEWRNLSTKELRENLSVLQGWDPKWQIASCCSASIGEMFFLWIHGLNKCTTPISQNLKTEKQ